MDLNGRNAWPNWTPDGKQLYFMSDRSGAQNIWTLPLGGKLRQVTKFTDGRVLWPSMGYDGKAVVFERDFKIWQLDTKTGEAYPLPITLVGSAASPEINHLSINQFTDLAVSADNRKIALVAHGEVFASSARDGGRAFRVTETPGPESQIAWAPDSMHLAYVSQRNALTHVFLYDFAKHAETQLTSGPLPDQGPAFSPDGKTLAFVRDRKELRAIDLASKQERLLVTGFIGGGFGGGSRGVGARQPVDRICQRCRTRAAQRVRGSGRGRHSRGRSAFWPMAISARSSGVRMASSSSSRPRSARNRLR